MPNPGSAVAETTLSDVLLAASFCRPNDLAEAAQPSSHLRQFPGEITRLHRRAASITADVTGSGGTSANVGSSKHESIGFAFLGDHSTFGLTSSCERAEFMFALVITLAPVSILAGTCSPFAAASAVLTPS